MVKEVFIFLFILLKINQNSFNRGGGFGSASNSGGFGSASNSGGFGSGGNSGGFGGGGGGGGDSGKFAQTRLLFTLIYSVVSLLRFCISQ